MVWHAMEWHSMVFTFVPNMPKVILDACALIDFWIQGDIGGTRLIDNIDPTCVQHGSITQSCFNKPVVLAALPHCDD